MQKWFLFITLSLSFFLVGCRAKSEIVLQPTYDDRTYTIDEAQEVKAALEQRVNALGITDANVRFKFQGDDLYFTIELDSESTDSLTEIVQVTSEIGLLEFVDYAGLTPEQLEVLTEPGVCVITDYQMELGLAGFDFEGNTISRLCENPLTLADTTPFTTVAGNDSIKEATASRDTFGANTIIFSLTDGGSEIFENHTSTHIGEHLAIVVNGQVISAPTIQATISGTGNITGNFTAEEVQALAIQLNSALLTIPLEVIEINDSEGISLLDLP